MKFIKVFLVLFFSFFFGVESVLASDTYFITQEQLNNLMKQINNLQSNNASMMSLLETQKLELESQKNELENQTNEFQILETNYLEKFLTMEKQLKNSQQLLNLSKNKESIYKYGIGIAFAIGIILGVFVAK